MPVSRELRNLQEALDAQRENIPEGTYVDLMQHVRNLYTERQESESRYWIATVVQIAPVSARRLSYEMHTCILQEVERSAGPGPEGWLEVLRNAQISRDCARSTNFPVFVRDGRGGLNIVVQCEEEDGYDSPSESL